MVLEVYADILAILATAFGIIASFGYFTQIYKMYKRKSSADVSVITYLTFFSAILMWFLYGISINNAALIIANTMGLVGAAGAIITYFIYKK